MSEKTNTATEPTQPFTWADVKEAQWETGIDDLIRGIVAHKASLLDKPAHGGLDKRNDLFDRTGDGLEVQRGDVYLKAQRIVEHDDTRLHPRPIERLSVLADIPELEVRAQVRITDDSVELADYRDLQNRAATRTDTVTPDGIRQATEVVRMAVDMLSA